MFSARSIVNRVLGRVEDRISSQLEARESRSGIGELPSFFEIDRKDVRVSTGGADTSINISTGGGKARVSINGVPQPPPEPELDPALFRSVADLLSSMASLLKSAQPAPPPPPPPPPPSSNDLMMMMMTVFESFLSSMTKLLKR
jgi:hypothetical protein